MVSIGYLYENDVQRLEVEVIYEIRQGKLMIGSVFWRVKENEIVSGNYNLSGIQINFRLREFVKPNGTPVLSQNQVNPDWLSLTSPYTKN